MKKTQIAPLYPWAKGLDRTSIPGSQDPRSLTVSRNIIVNNRGSLKKRPGARRIPYTGREDGNLQGAIHFFATSGGAQREEIVRVIGGRIEAIRDGKAVDLGIQVSDTDSVTFERFANALLIHFENSPPLTYTIGGTPTEIGIFDSHKASPPTFSRVHNFRYWYGGRPSSPHILTVSAINDFNDYTLRGGGFAMRINDGDGDPMGLTGLSPTFRGDVYAYKLNAIYRITLTGSGYGVQQVTNEVGCVHHNTITLTQNDVFFVSNDAIHSLVNTDKFGSIEEYTVSYPIYEYFQEDVNWNASKRMISVYDKQTNTYLLSYTSSGSSFNDKVLGFNTASKEFFQWESVQYPVLAKYFDFGRQKVLVGDNEKGMGILEESCYSDFSRPIPVKARTGVIFPLKNPKTVVNFTKAWVYARPTDRSVPFKLTYYVNGDLIETFEFDTDGGNATFGGIGSGVIGEAIIGTDIIGANKSAMTIVSTDLAKEGNAIEFEIEHEGDESDPEQPFEIYGVVFEFDYNEDDEVKVGI